MTHNNFFVRRKNLPFIGEVSRLKLRLNSLQWFLRFNFACSLRICLSWSFYQRWDPQNRRNSCPRIKSFRSQLDSPWFRRVCSYLRHYLPDWIALISLWVELASLRWDSLIPRIGLSQTGLLLDSLGFQGPKVFHFARLFHYLNFGQDLLANIFWSLWLGRVDVS